MKRLPFNCRRCGQPCRDKYGMCIGCEDRASSLDAAIARNFPVHHTPATLFAQAGRAREPKTKKERV